MGNDFATKSSHYPQSLKRNVGIGKVLVFVLVLLTIECLVAMSILTVQALPTPSGDYLVTNPSISEYHYTTSKGNYLRLEVYGWQMDPSKEADLQYDYYFFHIWATSDAASNYCPTSAGFNDAYGPTMYLIASLGGATDEAFMTEYTSPTGYTSTSGPTTLTFNFGYSKSGGSIGLSWQQNVPKWECDTPMLTASEIDWRAAQADRAWSWNQAWAWGFSVGIRTPHGKGRCSLTASLSCNWFTGVYPFPTGSDNYGIFVASVYQGWTRNTVNPNTGRVYVDGELLTSPKTYAWAYNSIHNLDPDSGYSTGTGSRQIFTGWSDGSTADPRSVTVTGSVTYTANWKNQYYLTVSSPYDTPYGQGWYDSNTIAYASLTTGIVSGGTGVQYVFTSWSGDASGTNYAQSNSITMDRPKTANANWKTMYTLTVISNPPSVDNPRPSGWYDSGANVLVQCDNPVSGGTGIQYVFTQWSGDASGTSPTTTVNMNGPRTAIANYQRQYYLTVNSNPGGVDSPRTSGWYNEGTTQPVQCDTPVSAGSGSQYVFTQWSGDASGTSPSTTVYMSGPKTATANYKRQYYLTVASAHDSPNPAIGSQYYDDGQSIGCSVSSPADQSGGIRYRCTGYTGTGSCPSGSSTSVSFTIHAVSTITWNWWTQYRLTVASTHDSPSPGLGDTWYDAGTSVVASVTSPADQSGSIRYRCTGWIGTGSVPSIGYSSPLTFSINEASTITWNWMTQYSLTVASSHDSPNPSAGVAWYDSGTYVTASVTSPAEGYSCTGWTGTGSVPSTGSATTTTFTINQISTITWNWQTSASSHTYLVVRGADNGIYYRLYDGSSWGGWTNLPGSTLLSPASCIFNNRLHLIVVGTDGGLYWGNVDTSTLAFSGWTGLSGATPSPPVLAADATHMFLLVRGADNRIYYRAYDGSIWTSWTSLPGLTQLSPCASFFAGNLHLVVVGTDGTLYWGSLNPSTFAFSGWTTLSGGTPASPTLTSDGTNLCLVLRGTDSRIYYRVYDGSSWANWITPPGSTLLSPAASISSGRLNLVVAGTDGALYWGSVELSTSAFSVWTAISGNTPSAPTLTAH